MKKVIIKNSPCLNCGRGGCLESSDRSIIFCYGNRIGIPWVDEYQQEYSRFVFNKNDAVVPYAALADSHDLNSVYQVLLANLSLKKRHQTILHSFGMTPDAILKNGYKSLETLDKVPLVGELLKNFGPHLLRKVPGIVVKTSPLKEDLTIAGSGGILVPVQDEFSQIVGIKVLSMQHGGLRYVWLSSDKYGVPEPKDVLHVPLTIPRHHLPIIRVTVGELKADLYTAQTQTPTISIPSIRDWSLAIQWIQKMEPYIIKINIESNVFEDCRLHYALNAFRQKLHLLNFRSDIELDPTPFGCNFTTVHSQEISK